MTNEERQRARFGRHQQVAGWLMLVASVVLWTIEGIGWQPFGRQPSFGILPWTLLAIGSVVVLQLNIVRLLRGALHIDEDDEEDKA